MIGLLKYFIQIWRYVIFLVYFIICSASLKVAKVQVDFKKSLKVKLG